MTEPRRTILEAQEFIPLPMHEEWPPELIAQVIEALGGRERLARALQDMVQAVSKNDEAQEVA